MEQCILLQVNEHNRDKVFAAYEELKENFLTKAKFSMTQKIDEFLQLNAIHHVIEQESKEQFQHFIKVTNIASKFAKEFGLSQEDKQKLLFLAKYHDVGKINIHPEILNKPSKLNDEEWQEIKKHPIYSQQILSESTVLKDIADYACAHHERFDGTGYPYGIKGKEIPLLVRIISIFDAYEVITTGRVYKKGISHEEAILELKRCAGTQFDPEIVDAFVNITSNMQQQAKEN